MAEVEITAGPDPDVVVVVLLWSGRGLLLLLLLLGAVANGVALLAFCRGPGLRTLSNRFVMNLLVVNLAACGSLLPMLLLDSLLSEPNDVLCSVSEGVAAGYCTASILGVLLIAVDQYYAVVDPLRYHSKVDAVRSMAMLVAAWLCALLAGVLGSLEPWGAGLWASCHSRADADPAPLTPLGASLYRRVYVAAFALLVFVIPFAALCWIYVSIYGAAHRNSQRTRRHGSGSVAPSTPPPELSCSECRSLPSSVPATPSSTLSHHVLPAGLQGLPGLPVSRSAPAMDAVVAVEDMKSDLLPSRRSSLSSATGEDGGHGGAPRIAPTSSASGALGARVERRRSSCPSCPHAAHAVTVTVSPPSTASSLPGRLGAAPVRSASAWLVSSLRCRISNASLFRYREEGRAARVSAIVVVMALGCWLPYVAVLVLHAALPRASPNASPLPRHLDALALAALAAAVCISPCLFAFRNRRVQKEVRRMLCPRGRKSSLERGRRSCGASGAKGRPHGGCGSARRLLPHNLMASLAEDCSTLSTPSDSTSALTISSKGVAVGDDASTLTVSVSLLPTPLWSAHLLPDDALAVDTARSSFSSGASSSQGSALSTDTADE